MGEWVLNIVRFRLLIFTSFLIAISTPALCDEALLKVYGGGLKLFDGDSSSVRMESETVRIELHKKNYTVDATFEFFNYGKTITATVGFPKSGYGYTASFRGVADFISFETWVNGKKYKADEQPGEVTVNHQKIAKNQIEDVRQGRLAGWIEETRWMVKKVTFVGKAKTTTRVKYVAPYDLRNGDEKNGEYLYGTGGSWNGNISNARFIIQASPEISLLWAVFSEDGSSKNIRKYDFKRLGEYKFEYSLKEIKPKEDERLQILASSTWQAWDGPDYSIKHVARDRLELLSLWQLTILRNSIFALHGMIFKETELDKYFRKYDWYKPRPDFKESDLNKTEKENIAAIAAYENELRAALHQ